jgi:hypothetical protein
MHAGRRELMSRAMHGWTAEEQQRFAELLTRFVAGLDHEQRAAK